MRRRRGATFLLFLLSAVAVTLAQSQPPPPVAGLRTPTTFPARRQTAPPGFTGSAHDFFGPDVPLSVRCAACHAEQPPTPRLFTRDSDAAIRQRQPQSRPRFRIHSSTALCLSCHDGTLARAVGAGDDERTVVIAGTPVNPHRDHPVGVEYPRIGRDRAGLRREYAPIAQLEAEGRIRLPDGRVECISCHDPHNAHGQRGMLVKSDRRSALCLSCHVK